MIHVKEHIMQRLLWAYMDRWNHLYTVEMSDQLADLIQHNPSAALKMLFPEAEQ